MKALILCLLVSFAGYGQAIITNPVFANVYSATATAMLPNADYSQTGTVIDDGGGSYEGNANTVAAKAFDNDNTTYYDAANGDAGKYVGRDLLTAKTVNRVRVLARQMAGQFGSDRLNGAQIQYSGVDMMWMTIATISGVTSSNYTSFVELSFMATTARYWRIYWPNSNSYGNVAEIQIRYEN